MNWNTFLAALTSAVRFPNDNPGGQAAVRIAYDLLKAAHDLTLVDRKQRDTELARVLGLNSDRLRPNAKLYHFMFMENLLNGDADKRMYKKFAKKKLDCFQPYTEHKRRKYDDLNHGRAAELVCQLLEGIREQHDFEHIRVLKASTLVRYYRQYERENAACDREIAAREPEPEYSRCVASDAAILEEICAAAPPNTPVGKSY